MIALRCYIGKSLVTKFISALTIQLFSLTPPGRDVEGPYLEGFELVRVVETESAAQRISEVAANIVKQSEKEQVPLMM